MACKKLKTHELKDCVLIATSEPCPMCLASSYWAGVKEIRYALGRQVAEDAGFRDIWIDEDIAKPVCERGLPLIHHPEFEEAKENFSLWIERNGKLY
jgi:tRNA(Arg) A34 adenosine deaminase TadA